MSLIRVDRIALVCLALFVGCGGCSDDANSGECPIGESYNPITNTCVPRDVNQNNDDRDSGNNAISDATVDMFVNPFLDMPADVPDELRCDGVLDSDLDGLTNACECQLATDPARPDTDRDGALDGQEDANRNCRYDLGQETNPREPDTDLDGLEDGDEIAAGTDPLNIDTDDDGVWDGPEVDSGCMDPLEADTDGDGLPDDIEDTNLDGMLGTCANRVYDPVCANGESDPCKTDTDGDGTPDSDEAQFLACRAQDTQGLVAPQYVTNVAGDYKLALELGIGASSVIGQNAHAFDDDSNAFAGFIASFNEPGGTVNAQNLVNHVYSQVSGLYPSATVRSSGRRLQTHDGFDAVASAIIELPINLRADDARDGVLARLAGVGSVTHGANGNFTATGAGNPMLLVFEVIRRGGTYVVSGATVPEIDYNNNNLLTGIRVDDITGGVGVALFNEATAEECVSYRVTVNPKIDFIWVLDGSGSMSEELNQVKAFAAQFATILQASSLDWRLAVTSGTCWDIQNDAAISAPVKALYGNGGFGSPCSPIPGFSRPAISNGALCANGGANFTTDTNLFRNCIDAVSGQFIAGELTVTMGAAAIDRALPRSDTDTTKIRPDAAVVIISVTDEFDELFGAAENWGDAGGAGDPPIDPTLDGGYSQASTDMTVQPFVDYFLQPDIGATVFGIYWIPGTTCNTAAEASAGIHAVVNATGGTAGSVCQNDLTATLQEIANASAGLASGLRLRGSPVAPSIEVKVGQAATGNIVPWSRSRADGFDYKAAVNRVTFEGNNPPQTNDRVVIPYLRWENSIQACQNDGDCDPSKKELCVDGVCI